jgi:hypothetical protein
MPQITALATFDEQITLRTHPLIASAHAVGDNRNTFEAFVRGFIADLAPAGAVESTLAARAAGIAWRLNRAQALETKILTTPDRCDHTIALDNGLQKAGIREAVDLVSRWEQGLERSLLKTLDALDKAQRARRRRQNRSEMGKNAEEARADNANGIEREAMRVSVIGEDAVDQ